MPVIIDGQKYYRTAEVYRKLGIAKNTLYRWLKKEHIGEVEHRDSRGWRLFTQEEVNRLDKSINHVVKVEKNIKRE